MSVQLVIDDGSPNWWDSTAIWVVPGTDPLGAPGMPIVGQQAYLWARVRNAGSTDVQQAKVDFWVANPSLQLRKSIARHIGAAFTDVAAGGSQDVLCLVPWSVELVNGGHECVIAEASSPADPLSPAPTDPDLIDPPTYRQVAQRNLSVLMMSQMMMKVVTIGVHAGARAGRAASVELLTGGELDAASLKALGLKARNPADDRALAAGLSLEGGCARHMPEDRRLRLKLEPGTSSAVHLHLHASERLGRDHYALVRVVEHIGDKLAGGITFVVTAAEGR